MATQQKIVSDLIQRIEFAIDKFRNAAPGVQERLFKKFQTLIRDFDLLKTGEIKPTVKNLRKVNAIAAEMRREILGSAWRSNVDGLETDIERILKLQVQYFQTIESGYKATAFMNAVTSEVIDGLRDKLLDDGLDANVVGKMRDLLRKNITEKVQYADLVEEMKVFLTGNADKVGALQSYSSQIVTDGLNQYAASLNKVFTDDLGLQWYRYVGSIIKDSRPWCVAMVDKQFVHQSELTTVSNGSIDGQQVSLKGLIAGTNASNIQVNRGGYNCQHLLLPVATESVPKGVRDKMTDKLNA